MPDYKYIDHTADLGIEVKGKSLEQLFINTARAIFETQIKGKILNKAKLSFEIKSISLEELLIEWCRELLYYFSVRRFIPKHYQIEITENFELRALLKGDRFDKKRHQIKLEVKNPTYHNLSVKKLNDYYTATLVFDV
uniref:Archease n=1 Tax=candidate division WOR-3 bacterium TaxID=2052148 RepID=A0A7C4XLE3_UNCW3